MRLKNEVDFIWELGKITIEVAEKLLWGIETSCSCGMYQPY